MVAEITVYATLPADLTRPLDLTPDNWSWVHCLTFPIDDLVKLELSVKPYKWIRYAIGVVIGAQGHLFDFAGNPINYDLDLPTDPIALRYHLSDDEKSRMFPADPGFARSTITSSASTSHDPNFRKEVQKRDVRCPLTEDGEILCDAVHLVAHSKNDEVCHFFSLVDHLSQ